MQRLLFFIQCSFASEENTLLYFGSEILRYLIKYLVLFSSLYDEPDSYRVRHSLSILASYDNGIFPLKCYFMFRLFRFYFCSIIFYKTQQVCI